MDSRAKEILELQDSMAAHRMLYEAMWREIGERCGSDTSFCGPQMPGSKRTQKMFDSTAPLAISRYAAIEDSMLTPRTSRWHGITLGDSDLNEKQAVREYCDNWTDRLFRARYNADANFASQANEVYLSDGTYGTGALFIDDLLGKGIRYRSLHLSELFMAENFAGVIDIVHRKFQYTARQAVQRFGDQCPQKVKDAAEKKPLQQFNFLHCVYPNEEYRRGALGEKGLKYLSTYICIEEKAIVRAGNGYRTFPYAIARGITMPGEIYGRSPAAMVLPDIKQLNEFEKTILKQGQLAVEPPILLPEDGTLTSFNMQPNALVWGGTSSDGTELAKPFRTGTNLAVGFDMLEQKRKIINDAFYITLFQILVQEPNMTATQAMLRAQEKAQLLIPTMGRKQPEFCGNIIRREIEILDMAGEGPPMPPELYGMSIEDMEIEYSSPLNRAQLAEEGVAISQTLAFAPSIEAVDPGSTRAIFQGKGAELLRQVARINGVRASLLNTADEEKSNSQANAQADQAKNMLAAAPVAADAAKNFAQAQATAAAPIAPDIFAT